MKEETVPNSLSTVSFSVAPPSKATLINPAFFADQ